MNASGKKHTPGPWEIGAEQWVPWQGAIEIVAYGDDRRYSVCWTTSGANEIANARLIAAAPEMREALTPFAEHAKERCADAPEWRDGDTVSIPVRIEDLRAVSVAIAKAEGRALSREGEAS